MFHRPRESSSIHRGAEFNPPATKGRCTICHTPINDIGMIWTSPMQSLAELRTFLNPPPQIVCCSFRCACVAMELEGM